MKKNIRGFFCALLALLLVIEAWFSYSDRLCAEEFEGQLYATAAVLMDADTHRVLYGKNADTPLAMASTTKIMTCILVLELGDVEEELEVSSYAASMPKVKLYMKQGETYIVRDLLYSLMLESHNDTAVALAEYVGSKLAEGEVADKPASERTVQESRQMVTTFANLMNEKARELGCEESYFITPNGLDATECVEENGVVETKMHCTTARELARIMAYCVGESPKASEFLEITGTASYGFLSGGRSFSCVNHNAFLNMMPGVISGKTGFTNQAGYCYVTALEREGRTFVVALLACGWPNNKTYKWSDARKLLDYGLEQYSYRSFREKEEEVLQELPEFVQVAEGIPDVPGGEAYTKLAIEAGEEAALGDRKLEEQEALEDLAKLEGMLMREDEEVCVEWSAPEKLTAPVSIGETVGFVEYKVDGVTYRRDRIVTTQAVGRLDLIWCVKQVLSRFLLS